MEQTFKIKFSIFGIEKIANVKAPTLLEAKIKLKEDIANQVKILTTEHKEAENPLSNNVNDIFGDKKFTDILGSIFGGKKP